MDERYEKNIKVVRLGGALSGSGAMGFGVAKFFINPEIILAGFMIMLGLGIFVIAYALSMKMEHDLERDKNANPKDYPDEFEHDIGY